MKQFDIILVLGYFRSATAYLSIIRHLSEELRICVVLTDAADLELKSKTADAYQHYLDLCRQFGAEIMDVGEQLQTKILMVQQFPYPDETAKRIKRSITAPVRVGLMTLAMAGVDKYDSFLSKFNIQKVFVPNRRLMFFLLEQRGAGDHYSDVDVREVGLPFARYPIFPEFKTDWIIAAPTLFSFHNEKEKHIFLKSVLKLLSTIPTNEKVVYKSHNGNVRDYFTPRVHYRFAKILVHLPGSKRTLEWMAKIGTKFIKTLAERTLTGILHLKVISRATPLIRETPYGNIALEAFLPGVKKGVIGGLSNTIWGTLYCDLPFYNCVRPSGHGNPDVLNHRSGDKLLRLNLKFFGVQYCNGEIDGGCRGKDIVFDYEREGDLINALREEIPI